MFKYHVSRPRRAFCQRTYVLGRAGKRRWEDDLQIKVVDYMRLQYPKVLFTSCPANHFIKPYLAKKQKAMGYSTGTPDLIIPFKCGDHAGLFIELKSERAEYTDADGTKKIHVAGTLSDEQILWIAYLRGQGYRAEVCTGFSQAKGLIDEYFKLGAQ